MGIKGILDIIGCWELSLRNYSNAFHYFMKAYKIGDKLIPKNYNGRIIWGILNNRPFLRSMHGLGLTYLFMQEWDKSSTIFKKILGYNPNDQLIDKNNPNGWLLVTGSAIIYIHLIEKKELNP